MPPAATRAPWPASIATPRRGITQPSGAAGCISESGAGRCADGHGLNGATAVSVSPDKGSVYVAAVASKAVARFNRVP